MTALAWAAVTFVSTGLGGLFALRFRDRMHLILAFGAGTLFGAAFFDLLPGAFRSASDTGISTSRLFLCVVGGFLFYHLIEKWVIGHSHITAVTDGEAGGDHGRAGERAGLLGAGGFAIHSYFDGLAIGIAFQHGAGLGLLVALAVIGHDFSDGINTVSVLMRHRARERFWYAGLLLDALTPLLGVASAIVLHPSEEMLAYLLAVFAGFFIYISASDLLPEAHHEHSSLWTILVTFSGTGMMYGVTQVAADLG